MIACLTGILLEKKPTHICMDVQGVGYEVLISMNTFFRLPPIQTALRLYTQLIIREEGHFLYGFDSEMERIVFRELIKISGVGPKLALTVLSGMEPSHLLSVLAQGNVQELKTLPGVGAKLAERLVVELRDKVHKITELNALPVLTQQAASSRILDEALEALLSLGYKPVQAKKMLEACGLEHASVETMIRMALQVKIA